MHSQNRKKRQRGKIKEDNLEKVLEMKIKETQSGS